ncbi:MAG: hypothetical protein HQK96_11755 [Nitrospirae bacterium]|nr:hypothetical protein [Nitrospirota bacterium]
MSDMAIEENIERLINNLRNNLISVLAQIDKGFKHAMRMYIFAFYTGLSLIVISVIGSFYGKNIFLVFGGIGFLDIATLFIYKPAENLQISRGNLIQLQVAFHSWLNDLYNWNTYMEDKSKKPDFPVDDMVKISKVAIQNALEIMKSINVHVEVKNRKKAVAKKKNKKDNGKENEIENTEEKEANE